MKRPFEIAGEGTARGAGVPALAPGDTHSPAATRNRLILWLVISAVAIAVVIVIGTAVIISSLRNHVLSESRHQVENLAYTLAEESDRSIQAVDLVAKGLSDHIKRMNIVTAADFGQRMSGYDTHLLLQDAISGLPHVESISFFDAQGKLINYNRTWPTPSLDISDRPYFHALMADRKLTTILSEPLRNKSAGSWSMYLARKVLGPDNEPLGLVVGGLELKSFEDLFNALVLEEGMQIALLHHDGTVLANRPHVDSAIGTAQSSGDPVAAGTRIAGHIVSTRDLTRYPAAISVSAATVPALADWRTEAVSLAIATLLVVLMIAGIAFVTVRRFDDYELMLTLHNARAEADAARRAAETLMSEREQAQERLEDQNLRFHAAIDNMPQGLAMFNANARLVVCNERYIQMYGLTRDFATPGRRLRDIIAYQVEKGVIAADTSEFLSGILTRIHSGEPSDGVAELSDGRTINILNRPMDGGGWVSTHEDVTERRRAERQLQRTEKFLASVIENVPTTITVRDARDLRYLLVNKAGEKYYGLPRSEIVGKTPHELFPEATADLIVSHDKELLKAKTDLLIDEHPIDTPSGEHRLITAHRLSILDENGEPQYLLSLIEDVTERKQAERKIAHFQQHDALTGLPNRTALAIHLADKLERAEREHASFALLMVDLDRFKALNDVLGQAVGDDLMREIARRLETASDGAFLAHVGSDEFVLTTADGPQPATAEKLCERLLAAMGDKVVIEGHRLPVALSIGVAMFPADGTNATALLGNADAALNRAKSEGRGTYRFFEAGLDHRLRDRRALNHDLLAAIERGEFALHYQPLAKRDGEVTGFEALLRWQHPTRGMVPPAEFIPLAEDSGQILAIGAWVLREACRQAMAWPRPLHIAVNVSPVQFRQGDLVALVHSVLLETGLPANRLTIEITEGVLVGDFSHAVSILRRLKLLGVQIAMDDFGTGYSSLSYLRSIPFDKIKIDRSFIMNLGKDPQTVAIVRGVIDLVHSLGLKALAEGVETREQLTLLREASCDELQGYLIGRPFPIAHYGHLVGTAAALDSAHVG